jgi:hypothetical protein
MLSTVLFCAWADITNAAHSNIDMTVFLIVVKVLVATAKLRRKIEKAKRFLFKTDFYCGTLLMVNVCMLLNEWLLYSFFSFNV